MWFRPGPSLLSLIFLLAAGASASAEVCEFCGKYLQNEVLVVTDEISERKKDACWSCVHSLPACFLCSLPVRTNLPGCLSLDDGRTLCKRDAATAVVLPDEGVRVGREVLAWLNREFQRFMEFSDTNFTVTLVDRPSLTKLFKYPGRDATCPDTWGTTQLLTNNGVVVCEVSLLSGMPLALLRHTAGHEFAHTWLLSNVSKERVDQLDRDAHEGFCELVAWLVDEPVTDSDVKSYLRRNQYTRGQIDLFLSAYRQFGMNEILEWLQYGIDNRLVADKPAQIRDVAMPARTNGLVARSTASFTVAGSSLPKPAYAALILQGIVWDKERPMAIINGNPFRNNEQGRVSIAGTNVALRCLAIERTSVRIEVGGVERELKLVSRDL